MLLDMFIVITVPNKARLYVVGQRYTVKQRVGLAGKRGIETPAALCRKINTKFVYKTKI